MAIKYKVILTEEERVMLSDIVNKGKRRQIIRLHSQILLNIDQKKEGKAADIEIAKILNTSADTRSLSKLIAPTPYCKLPRLN